MPLMLPQLKDITGQLEDMQRALMEINELDWIACHESAQLSAAMHRALAAVTLLLAACEAVETEERDS